MPEYVTKALHKFKQDMSSKPEYSPHAHAKPVYGAKIQYAEKEDDSEKLDQPGINRIQQIVGTFLYYGIAIDNTILPALSDIAAEQSVATVNTIKKVTKLLNYLATNPDAAIQYHASGMVLCVHSDASYLSVTRARSRASGVFFLSDMTSRTQDMDTYTPLMNGIIHVVCKILKNVMASAAEVEFGAVFINGQDAVPIRTTLA